MSFTRRRFIASSALAVPFILPSGLRAGGPSKKLAHAAIGIMGQAASDIGALTEGGRVEVVAIADVDRRNHAAARQKFPKATIYQDWRELLDKEKNNIDSVNVSTPDHMHAPIGMSAMHLGKHLYCQKPLAHDLHEVRAMTKLAREKKLVTQMCIQIHSQKEYRMAVALVQSGAIGKVKEVHTWSNKKWGDVGAPPAPTAKVPDGFNWDLWQGGRDPRPFVGETYYHPENWRKRLDFGTGTFGDMGCHIFDPVFEALALTAPLSLRSEGPAPDKWNWAINAKIHYVFPGTRFTADKTVPLTWYDGDERPPAEIQALVAPSKPAEPAANSKKSSGSLLDQGSIVIGTEGVLHVPHIAMPRLFPEAKFKDYPMPQVEGSHHWSNWAQACVAGGAPSANFDYSGPLTESVILGSVAVRFPKTKLEWNSAKLQFDNVPEANAFVRRTYRQGWEVAGL